MKILDLSAGNRAVWFDKNYPGATYVDIRPDVNPSVVADSRALGEAVGSGGNPWWGTRLPCERNTPQPPRGYFCGGRAR